MYNSSHKYFNCSKLVLGPLNLAEFGVGGYFVCGNLAFERKEFAITVRDTNEVLVRTSPKLPKSRRKQALDPEEMVGKD